MELGCEDALLDKVIREYPHRTGLVPKVYAVAAVDGAGEVAIE